MSIHKNGICSIHRQLNLILDFIAQIIDIIDTDPPVSQAQKIALMP